MKKQDAEPASKPAAKGDDLYLTEAEIDALREEFRANLEKMQEAMRAARPQDKAGLD